MIKNVNKDNFTKTDGEFLFWICSVCLLVTLYSCGRSHGNNDPLTSKSNLVTINEDNDFWVKVDAQLTAPRDESVTVSNFQSLAADNNTDQNLNSDFYVLANGSMFLKIRTVFSGFLLTSQDYGRNWKFAEDEGETLNIHPSSGLRRIGKNKIAVPGDDENTFRVTDNGIDWAIEVLTQTDIDSIIIHNDLGLAFEFPTGVEPRHLYDRSKYQQVYDFTRNVFRFEKKEYRENYEYMDLMIDCVGNQFEFNDPEWNWFDPPTVDKPKIARTEEFILRISHPVESGILGLNTGPIDSLVADYKAGGKSLRIGEKSWGPKDRYGYLVRAGNKWYQTKVPMRSKTVFYCEENGKIYGIDGTGDLYESRESFDLGCDN